MEGDQRKGPRRGNFQIKTANKGDMDLKRIGTGPQILRFSGFLLWATRPSLPPTRPNWCGSKTCQLVSMKYLKDTSARNVIVGNTSRRHLIKLMGKLESPNTAYKL